MYELLKILHIFSVIAWMVVLFYAPRLFVYHVKAERGGELDKTLQTMERRLMLGIGIPASLGSWIFGLWLAIGYVGFSGNGWLHAKIAVVVLLTVFHMVLARYRKAFAGGVNKHSETFFRLVNEIPTLLLIVILVLLIVRPF